MKSRLVMLISVWAMIPTDAFAEITIANFPVVAGDLNYNALTNNGQDDLEKEIFDKMQASSEMFSFTTLPKALDHYKTRREIVTAIGQMAKNGTIDFWYPAADTGQYPVLATGEVFETVAPWKDLIWLHFQAKTGVKASTAIKCIEGGTTRSDCRAAAGSAILIGHRRALGDDFIDGKIGPGTLKIGPEFHFLKAPTDMNTIIPGDTIYMKNKDDYRAKAIKKRTNPIRWQGERCIYVGNGLFTGLGQPDINEADLRAEMAEHYFTDTGVRVVNPQADIRFVELMRIEIQP